MVERALGKITALLADLGLEVTYAYDDLVLCSTARSSCSSPMIRLS